MTNCNIKNKIKEIIIKLKYIAQVQTDKDLAEIFEIDPSTFANWKNHSKQIPLENLLCFCEKYDVSLDSILRDGFDEKIINTNDCISFVYIKDINSINKPEIKYIERSLLPIQISSDIDSYSLYATQAFSDEMSQSAPFESICFFDFYDAALSTSPNAFLFKGVNGYFIRNISKAPNGKLLISCENEHIEDIYVDQNMIEILGKLKGVIKWKV